MDLQCALELELEFAIDCAKQEEVSTFVPEFAKPSQTTMAITQGHAATQQIDGVVVLLTDGSAAIGVLDSMMGNDMRIRLSS